VPERHPEIQDRKFLVIWFIVIFCFFPGALKAFPLLAARFTACSLADSQGLVRKLGLVPDYLALDFTDHLIFGAPGSYRLVGCGSILS
jgi:hypothetical protein